MPQEESIWEKPERVKEFAARDADVRLMALLGRYDEPGKVRVLDLGCAGGRNTVPLVEAGFDVYALDSSRAMVAATRERVAALVGDDEARRRVLVGRMEDLSAFADGSFDLVVSLGVYHNARSRDDWNRALAESARLLRNGGLVLVSNFSPRCDPDGRGMQPVDGEPDVYVGFGSERLYLLEADRLDAEMVRHGLVPQAPTKTVTRETGKGRRVVINALYRKDAG